MSGQLRFLGSLHTFESEPIAWALAYTHIKSLIPSDSDYESNFRFLLKHPAHFIALGFGAGLSPIMPGTVGTLVAIPLAWALDLCLPSWAYLPMFAAFFLIGVWACDKTGHDLGVADHGGMVWDEIVAFLLVLVFVPLSGPRMWIAFVLFRFFDMVKPQPIRYFDARLKSGFGVMFDDILAAGYTLLVMALWLRFA